MKSPISNCSTRRRSSSIEDLAHLISVALRLEEEVDHADGEATSRANENRLLITNKSEGQDLPSPSTIVTNAVPSVADLLASHGKEDLPTNASSHRVEGGEEVLPSRNGGEVAPQEEAAATFPIRAAYVPVSKMKSSKPSPTKL